MSVSVSFYTYSKKRNSTAQPSAASTSFNMELKEPTSALYPTLWVAARDLPVPASAPTIYNYAYISDFQRRYFVSDWVYNAGIWEVSLSVDVLGSWKSGIGSISAYIERCSYTSDGDIMDTLYPAKTDFSISRVSLANAWYNVAPSGGTYVVGCINNQNSDHIGAISYYACTPANMNSLLNFLFGSSIYNAGNITEMGEGLYKSFFNPIQYIASCIWFPFGLASFGASTANIKIGYWDTGISANVVSSLAEKTYVTGTIPSHPQISRGSYLNHAPYTKMTLYIPPFGNIPLDTRFTEVGNYLYCPVWVDHITGEATIRVNITQDSSHLNDSTCITERTSMMGVPIQLAQVMNEYSKNPTGILSDILAEGIISIIGSSVGSSINCSTPTVTSPGANGSFINMIMPSTLVVEHALLVDENNSNLGRPLMSTRTISNIPGYIKAINPPVALSVTEQESAMIKEFMENGFYYE